MIQSTAEETIRLFPTVFGGLVILVALMEKYIMRLLGLTPRSEIFTTPRFQYSARITEKLARVFLFLFGLGFLVQGVGYRLFSEQFADAISLAALGLSGLVVLVIFGVVLFHWKA